MVKLELICGKTCIQGLLQNTLICNLPCEACSTVPREEFDSSVIMPFSWYIVAMTLPTLSKMQLIEF